LALFSSQSPHGKAKGQRLKAQFTTGGGPFAPIDFNWIFLLFAAFYGQAVGSVQADLVLIIYFAFAESVTSLILPQFASNVVGVWDLGSGVSGEQGSGQGHTAGWAGGGPT
jgi:hypothetical protein